MSSVTWKCSTVPSVTWPRTDVTSNHSTWSTDLLVATTALRMASSTPSVELPVTLMVR
jgi:hypothetical protein